MASTYAKNTVFHQSVGFISLLLITLGYLMLDSKQCQIPMLPRDELPEWLGSSIGGVEGDGIPSRKWSRFKSTTEISSKMLRDRNDWAAADRLDHFVRHYYKLVQVCHLVLAGWCGITILLGFINLIPVHEDWKVFTILTIICIMGLMALFALFTAFIIFHKPCRAAPVTPGSQSGSTESPSTSTSLSSTGSTIPASPVTTFYITRAPPPANNHSGRVVHLSTASSSSATVSSATSTVNRHRPQSNQTFPETEINSITGGATSVTNGQIPNRNQTVVSNFKLEFRAVKDKRPVNIYEDDDESLIRITLIDASVGFVMLCSNFLYFFDSRQHMIEWRN